MSDFVLTLSLLYCWLFDDSALVLGHGSEKDKNKSWFHGKLNISEKSKFLLLWWQFLIDGKWYSSHKFSEDLDYEKRKKKNLKRKCGKMILKLELAKWRLKHGLLVFPNARSILELMLCNRNLTKLVYPTLLSSDCRAWTLKLSENLKTRTKFSIKVGPKRTCIRYL